MGTRRIAKIFTQEVVMGLQNSFWRFILVRTVLNLKMILQRKSS